MRFAHGLDVGSGKGVKDKLKIFDLRTGSMQFRFVTWGRLWIEQSWLKNKNHIIILVITEKTFGKIRHHPFMIKNKLLSKLV